MSTSAVCPHGPEQDAVDVEEIVALMHHMGGGVRVEEIQYPFLAEVDRRR